MDKMDKMHKKRASSRRIKGRVLSALVVSFSFLFVDDFLFMRTSESRPQMTSPL